MCGIQRPDAITLSQLDLLPRAIQIVSFGWCCEYTQITELVCIATQHIQGVDRIFLLPRHRLLGVASLLILFIILNITLRLRFHVDGVGHTVITSHATPPKPIRDLLLEGRASISDELIRNLVPKRT